jgi:hypothetical protein
VLLLLLLLPLPLPPLLLLLLLATPLLWPLAALSPTARGGASLGLCLPIPLVLPH